MASVSGRESLVIPADVAAPPAQHCPAAPGVGSCSSSPKTGSVCPQAYAATHLSYLFNTFLPGRLGELVRGFLVVESEAVSPGRSLGTIFVEKLLDIAMLLVLLAGLLGLSAWHDWARATGTPLPGWGCYQRYCDPDLGAGRRRWRARRFWLHCRGVRRHELGTSAGRGPDPPVGGPLARARTTASVVPRANGARLCRRLVATAPPRGSAAALGGDGVGGGLTLAVAVYAYQLSVPLSAAFLLLVVTNLSMTIPSAPGYIGVYHSASVLTLLLFPSVSEDQAGRVTR